MNDTERTMTDRSGASVDVPTSAAVHALAVYGSHHKLVWNSSDPADAKPCPKARGPMTDEACTCGFDAALEEVKRLDAEHPYHEACRKCYAKYQSKLRRIEKLAGLLRQVAQGDTEVDMQGGVSIRLDQALWKRILAASL